MKQAILYMLLAAFVFSFQTVVAQDIADAAEMTKTEKKFWKKKAKEFKKNPQALKTLSEERDHYKNQIRLVERKVQDLEALLQERDMKVAQLNQKVEEMDYQLEVTKESLNQLSESDLSRGEMVEGIVFKVQIGAFKGAKISSDLDTAEALALENSGQVQKIVVGQFREYEKAERLKNHLRKLGVKDAWIATYKDGKRIPIKQARR